MGVVVDVDWYVDCVWCDWLVDWCVFVFCVCGKVWLCEGDCVEFGCDWYYEYCVWFCVDF